MYSGFVLNIFYFQIYFSKVLKDGTIGNKRNMKVGIVFIEFMLKEVLLSKLHKFWGNG
jgi:hypothetical protein